MKQSLDLSELDWRLSGWSPNLWRTRPELELGSSPWADVRSITARVPGSVQGALLKAGLVPDWNQGLYSRACEWIENRHWVYETAIPDEWLRGGSVFRLVFLGLDYSGWIVVNGEEVAVFKGSFVPNQFDLAPYLRQSGNTLRVVFDCPPRWLGYCGATSQWSDWKPRFNYTWDWSPRVVQVGVWDSVVLEVSDGAEIEDLECVSSVDAGIGSVTVRGAATAGSEVELALECDGATVRVARLKPEQLREGVTLRELPVELPAAGFRGRRGGLGFA